LLWKERLAQLVRISVVQRLMLWGISLTVARQRVGVAIIAEDENGRILMLRHVFHPYSPWGLPGGWLNRNEAPAAGALRELREETGLTAALDAPVYVSYDPTSSIIGIVYKAKIHPGSLSLSSEILEANWYPVEALPSPITPTVKEAIEAAVSSGQGIAS